MSKRNKEKLSYAKQNLKKLINVPFLGELYARCQEVYVSSEAGHCPLKDPGSKRAET